MVVPLFEMKLSKKPIAIIKMGDRNVTFVKINKYNSKYFTTKDGQTYELDDEYEYRYKKTGVYFYNFSNSKPLSLSAISEIDTVMRDNGESELFNKERFMSSVGDDPNIDVSTLNIPKDISKDMSPETKRFLQDHATDDETSKTDMMINVHTQKKPIPKYSSHLIGMGMNRTGYAFVQVGYQRLDIVPMYVNDTLAYTQYGVFEIDKDNVYFLKKQMLCFFIVSDHRDEIVPPMKKKPYKVMKTMVKKQRWKQLNSFIKPIAKNGKITKKNDIKLNIGEDITDDNDTTITNNNNSKKKQKIPRSVSISSEKKLIQYQADSPSVCYTTMKELHLTKEAVANKLSDPLKKAIPIVLIFGALMGFVMLLSNLPPIIDTVADRVSGKPDVFVMTPEEYEQWEIDNGLREEKDRRYLAGLGADEYQSYLDAGGTPYEGERGNSVDINPTISLPENLDGITTIDEPPVIMPPLQTVFEADNTNGMKVKFDVVVTDDIDVGLVPDCTPNRGAILAPGDHNVTCHVQDSAGNVSETDFIITVNIREGVESVSIIPKIQPMPPIPQIP